MNHARNGKNWLESLLEEDIRDASDIEVETLDYVARVTGRPAAEVSPF
ncbi:MAG: hypothetical protein HN368_17975 [Spirochaetales bacterium]|jgi:hypothetical protein|nr:hypothetical protein [Spirochaetales bacterium]